VDGPALSAIIADAQRGDAGALDALVDCYSARLYGFFLRLVGHRQDAEDLMQEAFLRVVRMLSSYVDDGRFEAWLFRIAANLVRDRIRRARVRPTLVRASDDDPDDDPFLSAVHPDAEPGRPVELGEDLDRLQAALLQLSAGEREVITLRYCSQLSFKEIADTLDIPLGTALARSHRGLLHLRKIMEPDHDAAAPDGPASDDPAASRALLRNAC